MIEGFNRSRTKDIIKGTAVTAAGFTLVYGIAKGAERAITNHPHKVAFDKLANYVEHSDELPGMEKVLELPLDELQTRGLKIYGHGDSRMLIDRSVTPQDTIDISMK